MNDTDLIKNIGFDYGITAGLFKSHEGREIDRLKAKLDDMQKELEKARKTVELPERYIINENATILFWKDGEKTIVRKCEDDEFNPRLAFLTALFQHYCGMSKNKANKYLANLEVEKKSETKKDVFVKIVDKGYLYSSYGNFIEDFFPQFIRNWQCGAYPDKRKKYRLIGKHEHEYRDRICLLIQDIETKQVYIIGEEGVKEAK